MITLLITLKSLLPYLASGGVVLLVILVMILDKIKDKNNEAESIEPITPGMSGKPFKVKFSEAWWAEDLKKERIASIVESLKQHALNEEEHSFIERYKKAMEDVNDGKDYNVK